MRSGTPQGEAVTSYIVAIIMAARKAGAPMPKHLVEEFPLVE
jgi:hypothetical protein